MDRVVENLWLGDMYCITDVEDLKENNIQSILSVMRGTVVVQDVSVSRKDAETLIPHFPDRPSSTNKSKSTMTKVKTS